MRKIQTLVDDYPRSLKVISLLNQGMCNVKFFLRVVPPDDLLEVKEMYTELVIQYDMNKVTLAQTELERFMVTGQPPDFYLDDPENINEVPGTFQADSNGLLHIVMDLTPYIISRTGDNWVGFEVPIALQAISNPAVILLWKVELVHTTEGVRTKQS